MRVTEDHESGEMTKVDYMPYFDPGSAIDNLLNAAAAANVEAIRFLVKTRGES